LDWFEGKHFAEPNSKLHRLQPCNLSKIIFNLFDIFGTLDYHPLYTSYDDKILYHSFCVLCTHICLNLFIFLGEGNSLFTDNRPSLGTERCLVVLGPLGHFELSMDPLKSLNISYLLHSFGIYNNWQWLSVKLEDLIFVVLNSGHHEIYWDKRVNELCTFLSDV
jgi:hypothetical protein